jgi:hypothetical protein
MKRTYRLSYVGEERDDDCYDDTFMYYCDQFSIPFMRDYYELLKTNTGNGLLVRLGCVVTADGLCIWNDIFEPWQSIFGEKLGIEFDNKLWDHRLKNVEVTIEMKIYSNSTMSISTTC